MSRKRRTSVQGTIEPKEKRKKKSKKITPEKIGEKISKGVAAVKKVDIALQKWAAGPVIPIPKKGRIARAHKAEVAYAERLERLGKAREERMKKMNKLVGML